jgi:hypothetical protein
MKIASFDIGEKNFAYCIVQFEGNLLKVLKISHYNVLSEIKNKQTILNSCLNISNILENDFDIDSCDTILIEQQLGVNSRAQKISQHIWSYFHTKYILIKKKLINLEFIHSSLKTQIFLGKNKLKSDERKKWSVEMIVSKKVLSLSKNFGIEIDIPENIQEIILKMNKRDDVCDTILQAIAYCKKILLK